MNTQPNANQVLKTWIDSVNAKQLADVIQLYDQNAVLLPTFSNQCFDNLDSITGYFQRLASYKLLNVEVHDNTVKVDACGENAQVISGIYSWNLGGDDEILKFEARFTFVVKQDTDRPILHHHSSQVPQSL